MRKDGKFFLDITSLLLISVLVCILAFILLTVVQINQSKILRTFSVDNKRIVTHIQKSKSDSCSYNDFGCVHVVKVSSKMCSRLEWFSWICSNIIFEGLCGSASLKGRNGEIILFCSPMEIPSKPTIVQTSIIKIVESLKEYESL